jgi:hypothetical protein
MAIKNYTAVAGQSIHDVCLNTYGTLDLLLKLVKDNDFGSLDGNVSSRQVFTFDDDLVVIQGTNASFLGTPDKYATDLSNTGAAYFDFEGSNIIQPAPPTSIGTGQTEPTMYEATRGSNYVSGADGTAEIFPLDDMGNTMSGNIYKIVQLELEIKPIPKANYQFDPVSGKLTLLNGVVVDAGQTLSFIYTVQVIA